MMGDCHRHKFDWEFLQLLVGNDVVFLETEKGETFEN